MDDGGGGVTVHDRNGDGFMRSWELLGVPPGITSPGRLRVVGLDICFTGLPGKCDTVRRLCWTLGDNFPSNYGLIVLETP